MSDKEIPNLFIVGAAKAGTTSVYNYLKAHEEIFMSPIKEPNFFGSDVCWDDFKADYKKNTQLDYKNYFSSSHLEEKHIAFLQNEAYYLKLFKNSHDYSYRGEASTSYLYSRNAAQEIYNFNSKAKIIIIVREPVDRALSHYFMDLGGGSQRGKDPLKAIKIDYEMEDKGWGKSHLYIELSLYYASIKRFLEHFPPDQVCLLNYDLLRSNKEDFIKKIFNFLNLELKGYHLAKVDRTFNQTLVPKNRFISKAIRVKKIFPSFLNKFIKKHSFFLFDKRDQLKVSNECKQYIKDLTEEDWKKTLKLLE